MSSGNSKKEFTGVRAKLQAFKDANDGTVEKQLPQSGINVQIPKFMTHGSWMAAQRQAKGDLPRAQAAYVMGNVTFEGEKLTMADVQSGLISASDMLFLIGEVFGDDDDAGSPGVKTIEGEEVDPDDAGNGTD